MTYIDFFSKKVAELKGRVFDSTWFYFFAFIHILTLKIVSTGCVNSFFFWLDFFLFNLKIAKFFFSFLFSNTLFFFHETFQEINSRGKKLKKDKNFFCNFLLVGIVKKKIKLKILEFWYVFEKIFFCIFLTFWKSSHFFSLF